MLTFEKIYLELFSNDFSVGSDDSAEALVRKLDEPSYEEYRAWHDLIGKPYNWHLRQRINDRTAIEALLAQPGVEMFLLQHAGETVGYALIEDEGDGNCEVSDFGFPPEQTGKGFGHQFFPKLLQYIFDSGIKRVWLSTRSTNDPRVVLFYESFGMKVYKRETIKE